MENIDSVLEYCFHESTLMNMYLDSDIFHFRFALPKIVPWYNDLPQLNDRENCCLVVDVICKKCKVKDILFEDTDVNFQNIDVVNFKIDKDNNAYIFLEDCYNYFLVFTCESYEVKEVGIIDYDIITSKVSDENYYKWYKLPYSRG